MKRNDVKCIRKKNLMVQKYTAYGQERTAQVQDQLRDANQEKPSDLPPTSKI